LEDLKKQKLKLESDIKILRSEHHQLLDDISENRKQENDVRQHLANWARELQDKEKALGIREERCIQLESTNRKNSNLLQI